MTTSPLAEYDAQIEAIRTQIEPLQAHLISVHEARSKHADRLAVQADDAATLMALRDASQVAYRKLQDLVRTTTHDAIWTFADCLPIEDDYTTGYAMGPHLSAERMPTDPIGAAALAESMVDFADRFCNPAPALVESTMSRLAGVDVCGMVLGDVLGVDPELSHSYYIYYTPDGSLAYLFDTYALGEIVAQGTLAEVLAVAALLGTERY